MSEDNLGSKFSYFQIHARDNEGQKLLARFVFEPIDTKSIVELHILKSVLYFNNKGKYEIKVEVVGVDLLLYQQVLGALFGEFNFSIAVALPNSLEIVYFFGRL